MSIAQVEQSNGICSVCKAALRTENGTMKSPLMLYTNYGLTKMCFHAECNIEQCMALTKSQHPN